MLDVREQIKKFQMLFDSKGKVINIKAALNDCPEVFKQDSPFTLYAARTPWHPRASPLNRSDAMPTF